MALTRKPRKGDIVRWPHSGIEGVVVTVEDSLCWIDVTGRPTEPFIWWHSAQQQFNKLAEIVEASDESGERRSEQGRLHLSGA